MGTPILEMICFAIVALALVAPKLILHLMNDRPAQSGEKTASDARRRTMLSPPRTGRRDQTASG